MRSRPDGTGDRRRGARGLAALAALGTLAAGCGAVTPPQVAVRSSPAVSPAVRRQPPWPPGGSRALARSVGRHLLASLVLPPGSRRAGGHPGVRPAEVIGSLTLVDVHKFFVLPMPMQAAASFFNLHPPAGLRAAGTGNFSSGNGVLVQDVTFSLRAPPVGVTSDTMLLVSLSGGPHGSTLARADAEVVWYPPRTAAEYLRPAGIRSARVAADLTSPRPRHVARVITSRRAIARLAALLNGLRAADKGSRNCPSFDRGDHVTFTSRGGGPRVAVEPTGCAIDTVSVNGNTQPPLWDPAGRLIQVLNKLLGLSLRDR